MSSRSRKFEVFQKSILEQLVAMNERLDKIASIMISDQLLQECITPDGQARTAEECADIVRESFCAGMCLSAELNSKSKEFAYQMSEFFIEDESEEGKDNSDENDDDDNDTDNNFFNKRPSLTF